MKSLMNINSTTKPPAKAWFSLQSPEGMYGFPQGGLLGNEFMSPAFGALTIDDFGIKYDGREHAEHLYRVLCNQYQVTTDWASEFYIGIHLCWDYNAHPVHLFMPGYVQKALTIFRHHTQCHQNQPYPHTPIKYGAKKQYAKEPLTVPLLDKHGKKFIHQVCGKILILYSRAVGSTLLVPLSAIASHSSPPTTNTLKQTSQLLDYLATQRAPSLHTNAAK
eukprot:CCRYP_019220-RA/>CCRYP_019220-RA protein AED:0.35 eAED:0.35 QI:0/0/0/1/0/0/2/0/219